MEEYEVTWSIYLEAGSVQDAALQAKGILQDPGNEAWGFRVGVVELGPEGAVHVDAQFEDEMYPAI